MSSLMERLKRRKLLQWGVAYLAGAWLLLQVLDILAEPFGLPYFILRVATVILAIGFLGALVVAWYHGERGAQRLRGSELLMLTVILGAAAAAAAFVGGGTPRELLRAPVPEQNSIAVLPFLNMSSDPEQEYFSDGLTEELLNVLAQLPELRVASRTSAFAYKDSRVAIDSIARALRVAHVLEGSVRRSGEQIRITAQLIRADNGYHLWSETYDREFRDVFAVQDEISHAIVSALEVRLGRVRANRPFVREETSDPEAYALVLKGAHFARLHTREGYEQAVKLFRESLARDSVYARAWAELARVYSQQAYLFHGPRERLVPMARAAAERAAELDPRLAQAHFALAEIARLHDWDFRDAEAHFSEAIALNPGLAFAHSLHGWLLMQLGRADEAIAEAQQAAQLDPVSVGMLANLGATYTLGGEFDLAVKAYRAALEIAPEDPYTILNLALTVSYQGRHPDAIRLAEHASALAPDDQYMDAALAYVYGRAGRRADAEAAIARLQGQEEPSDYLLATAHAGLGDADRVFPLLDRAVRSKDPSAPDLGVDPTFDPYRSDPRMRLLLDRIGLP